MTSSTDILGSVIDHLRKRKLCRSIYQDLQMWKVDDFEKKNDHYTILLNYLGYCCQRITIKANPFPSVTIFNTLNDSHIAKVQNDFLIAFYLLSSVLLYFVFLHQKFPEMNAGSAFSFVLNVERTRRCNASRHFSKETQMMSSLLHNLLDVIEEMQIAQIEISNLILIRFNSPSDEQLDLQLSFINFQSGWKVNLVLDISDLSRGIYPSEVLPHKVESPASTQYALSESMLNGIRTAVGDLDPGYSRILRVCRCVSEAVQVSSSRQ
ncbi:Cytochrome P450 [Cucumis melo var. makuwa]|uniref:Cytochrome P450 n=1 Tax=Cucumis melo var. makuwa TaxID=1194695 RepID=A0A5A7V0K0_CUCMM|nr:Cytochrome P450 [Cucumis melo var. makuwa]